MPERKLKFLIAGGGTGGHIFPAIAIARALQGVKPDAEFLFVGALGKMEMEKIPQAGFRIIGISIAGFNRSSLIKNISLPFKLISSFWKVAGIIKQFKPDAVIGVGGYSTFPVLRYAQTKGIPTFIHEANSFGGKSNILLSKKANIVFVATEGMEKFFPSDRLMVSGNPVRKEITECTVSKTEALSFFGLESGKATVFVMGGSLGAKSINHAVSKMLDDLSSNNIQLIWQTGKSGLDMVKQVEGKYKGVKAMPFIDRMDLAYQAADVVVSRSGAMSVAELCAVKKPAIFVPFPHAAEDHQTANAKYLTDRDAALMIKDAEVEDKLKSMLFDLMNQPALQQRMSEKMGLYAPKDTAAFIANKIIENISKVD
jgi:UDP-N-acetylglucosamine--N-acetylmuramyl-(pentapeptide) pyrophosphoryl-undecaprenol N-acetylglucosamine transferase